MVDLSVGWIAAALALQGGSAPPEWNHFVAQVVDGADHHAVAGAEVWWLDPDKLAGEDARLVRERWLVPEEWIRRLGRHAVSDAKGRVPIVENSDELIVVTWHDGKFARHDFAWEYRLDRILPLELEDDRAQAIRVVDEAGAPAPGLEVAAWLIPTSYCGNGGECDERVWSATTDAVGVVTVPHADWFFRSSRPDGHHGESIHEVGLGFPTRLQTRVGREACRGDPPVIELTTPATERLDLELQRESGDLFTDPVVIDLVPFDPDRDPSLGPGLPYGSFLARDGHLTLSHVERGLPLCISYSSDQEQQAIWIDVRVPERDPSTPSASRILRATDHAIRIRGRAVNEAGKPWPERRLVGVWAPNDPEQDDADVELDRDGPAAQRTRADGRFSFPLWPRQYGADPPRSNRVVLFAIEAHDDCEFGEVGPPVRVELAATTDVAEIDVGDVVLVAPRLVVAGRVVDATGTPLPGANLHVVEAQGNQDSIYSAKASPSADARGRFASFQKQFEGPLAIRCAEPAWRLVGVRRSAGAPLEFPSPPIPIGCSDVEVVLAPYGGIRGRILLREGASLHGLALRTLWRGEPDPPDGIVSAGDLDQIDLYPDGSFEVHGPARRVAVQCRSHPDDYVLATSADFQIPPSGTVDVPTLVLDLRNYPLRK